MHVYVYACVCVCVCVCVLVCVLVCVGGGVGGDVMEYCSVVCLYGDLRRITAHQRPPHDPAQSVVLHYLGG